MRKSSRKSVLVSTDARWKLTSKNIRNPRMDRVFLMSLTDERMLMYNVSSSAKGASTFEGRRPRMMSRLDVGRRRVEPIYFTTVEANINCPDDLRTRHSIISAGGHEGLMR